ncbi:hypothetical protein [Sulfurimonas sp.]|uniref:hypothetical protein n=1 Tax=Sulfurimonas sp. TaxID=2022749 RepID=UPI00262B440F|nr:hypothetical protein [Sulfurimonas sp.]MDD5157288.1 hypothetical protein [Sulfurimonas sp.]
MGIEKDIEFGWLCKLIQKLTKKRDCVDGVLKVLWWVGFLTLVGLFIAMWFVDEPTMLIGAFAILIAAFTASFSVMRSINHSALMEEKKRLNEIHKRQEYVLQLLFNLQELLINLNQGLHALSQREPLPHTVEDINQRIKRYNKILRYLESESTLIHLDSEEIKTIFDIVEGSEKWLKTVNMFLEKLVIHLNPDDIEGYESYYLHLEWLIPEAKKLFARELA